MLLLGRDMCIASHGQPMLEHVCPQDCSLWQGLALEAGEGEGAAEKSCHILSIALALELL